MKSHGLACLITVSVLVSAGWSRSEDQLPSVADMGYCADVHLMEDFDDDKFLGTWYVQLEVPNSFAEVGRCTSLTYSKEGSDMNLLTEAWNSENERFTEEIFLDRMQKNATTPYYVMIRENTPQIEYSIVGTDYVSYACTYTCFQIIGALRVELFFVTTREPNPPADTLSRCDEFFYDNYIDSAKLGRVNQTSDVCSAQWREDNLQNGQDISGETTPKKNQGGGHRRSSNSASVDAAAESQLEDLSANEVLDVMLLARNVSAFLEAEEDTKMVISLIEEDFKDELDNEASLGNASGLNPASIWKLLLYSLIILNVRLFIRPTS